MSISEAVSHDRAHASSPFSANAMTYKIKRMGARPLVFSGSELGMAMSFTPSLPYWYEINIYRTTEQRFVLAIRLFFQSKDERDTVQAWEFDSLQEALAAIEGYDAGQDVAMNMNLTDTMPMSEMAAFAIEMRVKTEAARRHYASLVGELFHDLDAAA